MLILTRRIGETIIIGKEITVTVLDARERGTRALLGVNAPQDIPVLREELVERDADRGGASNVPARE